MFLLSLAHERNIAVRAGLAPAGDPAGFGEFFFTFWAYGCIGGIPSPLHTHSWSSIWHIIHHNGLICTPAIKTWERGNV